jgi:hypothetical protein
LTMHVDVDCYSGYKADERPVRFRLDGHEYQVEELLDQWYGQNDVFFKVLADDGNVYILSNDSSSPAGRWAITIGGSSRDFHRVICMRPIAMFIPSPPLVQHSGVGGHGRRSITGTRSRGEGQVGSDS